MLKLYGNYEHSLDQKNRLRIPSKLKGELKDTKMAITIGVDHCLNIYPQEILDRIFENMQNSSMDKHKLQALRNFTSNMFPVDEDPQGRFVLNSRLRQYAGIDRDVVIVGACSHIEIWSKERWMENNALENLDVDSMYAELAEFGI